MPKEQTLIIIKPDAIEKKLIGYCITRFEKVGLKIKAIKLVRLKKQFMRRFYRHLKPILEPKLFNNIVSWMCSAPVFIIIVGGKNAVAKAKGICGATDPKKAKKGTIRSLSKDDLEKRMAQNKHCRNLIHRSGSKKEAIQEIRLVKKFLK